MIRPLTIVTFLMACGSGLYLYQSKHAAQVLDRDIERTVRDTATLREQSRLLAAEWTMLNDPETLRKFSDQYLALKSIAPTQFTSMAELKNRLPVVQINSPPTTPADTTDQDEDAPALISSATPPAATEPLPAATPALVTPAPVAPAVVAAKEPKPASVPVAAQVPAVVAIAKPPVDHPAERKVVAFAKPATPMPVIKTPESRPAEPRVAEARPNDARPVAASVSQPPMARPTVLAASAPAATRPGAGYIPAAAPVATQAAAPAQQQYSGSLLGMARSGTSPAPRPMPVSTAQWSNAN